MTATADVLSPDSRLADQEAAACQLRQAFVAQLKAARERRGISLQAIADITKVNEGLFADLERCDVSRWPMGIYRRSFFRDYADMIGVPGESTVSEFARLFPEDLEQKTSELLVPGPLRLTLAPPFWRRLSPVHAMAAGIDLAMVVAGSFAVSQLTQVSLWAVLALLALAYHTAGTCTRGCSLGTWWLRIRKRGQRSRAPWIMLFLLAAAAPAAAAPAASQQQQQATGEFKPEVGQAGKDVVWVPSPQVTVDRMLDLAKVTPKDFVMDLGSGDGRNVISAAKRGANALGVEYNPNMVELSRRLAKEAGVGDKAQFVEGDMFVADIAKANVMALFLLPSNLLRLRDKFLELQPGSRIVSNTFGIQDWTADETVQVENCEQWCTVMLYIVPAKIGGTWKAGSDVLEIKQEFQMVSGTLMTGGQSVPVTGSLRGADLSLKAGTRMITGRVQGNQIDGTIVDGSAKSAWRATK